MEFLNLLSYVSAYEALYLSLIAVYDKIPELLYESNTQQLHELDNQFCFLVPSKLLDPEYDCNLDSVPVDVSVEICWTGGSGNWCGTSVELLWLVRC